MRGRGAEGLRVCLLSCLVSCTLEHQAGDGFNPSASSTYHLFQNQKFKDPSGGVTDMVEAKALAQDVIKIGPFTAVHRFAASSPQGANAFRGSDGVIGLSYSALPDSASILQTLFHDKRQSWNVRQPPSFSQIKPRIFTVVMTPTAGELQLGGYDEGAVSGGVAFLPLASGAGYELNLLKISYGENTIMDSQSSEGGDAVGDEGLRASFDTGSNCLMLPDTTQGAEAGSPFRRLLDAHMREGKQELRFELGTRDGARYTLHLPYDDWTHPKGSMPQPLPSTHQFPLHPFEHWNQPTSSSPQGLTCITSEICGLRSSCTMAWSLNTEHCRCLGPYAGSKVVFGNPIFRRYVVVHKLETQPFSLGLGLRDPTYLTLSQLSELPVHLDLKKRENGVEKVALITDGQGAERRYLLPVSLGTPAQSLDLVLDTGSYLTEIFTCHPCGMEARPREERHATTKHKALNTNSHQHKQMHSTQHRDHKEEKTKQRVKKEEHATHKEHLRHERREAAKQRLALKAGSKRGQSIDSSPDTSDFQTSGVLVVAGLIAVVWVSIASPQQPSALVFANSLRPWFSSSWPQPLLSSTPFTRFINQLPSISKSTYLTVAIEPSPKQYLRSARCDGNRKRKSIASSLSSQ